MPSCAAIPVRLFGLRRDSAMNEELAVKVRCVVYTLMASRIAAVSAIPRIHRRCLNSRIASPTKPKSSARPKAGTHGDALVW